MTGRTLAPIATLTLGLLWAPLLTAAPPPATVLWYTTQAMDWMYETLAHPQRTLHVAARPAPDMAIVSRNGLL